MIRRRSHISALALVATALVGCGRTTVATAPRVAGAAPTTATTAGGPDHDDDTAPPPLDERRRGELGLPPPGVPPASWAPLTPAQWADPEAVAARYVLVDTTYAAVDDPGGVAARRAAYATARLAADLTTSSSGGARLDELRRHQTTYSGEVLTIATAERSATLTVVEVTARVTTTTADQPAHAQVRAYELTLARDGTSGRWQVARAEAS